MVQTSARYKRRIQWIDSARGIAMLCVIFGHMNIGSVWNKIIFSFHMPIFFLISGYFLKKEENRTFVKKKAKHLLIPYVFTSICLISLSQILNMSKVILHKDNIYPANKLFIEWIKAVILGSGRRTDFLWIHSDIAVGAIWFLLALFFSQCMVHFFMKKRFAVLSIIGIAILGIATAKYIWLPWSMQSAAAAAVFIMIGYIVGGKIGYTLYDIIKNGKIVCICIISWVIYLGVCLYIDDCLSIASATFPLGPVDFLGATAASFVVFWFSYRIVSVIPMLERFLIWFGKNSLIVLCFHLIELTCIPIESVIELGVSFLGIQQWFVLEFLTYTAKIIWSCGAIYVVRRNRILCYVFEN